MVSRPCRDWCRQAQTKRRENVVTAKLRQAITLGERWQRGGWAKWGREQVRRENDSRETGVVERWGVKPGPWSGRPSSWHSWLDEDQVEQCCPAWKRTQFINQTFPFFWSSVSCLVKNSCTVWVILWGDTVNKNCTQRCCHLIGHSVSPVWPGHTRCWCCGNLRTWQMSQYSDLIFSLMFHRWIF